MIVLSEQAQTAKEVRREVETSLETKDLRERLSHRRSKVAV